MKQHILACLALSLAIVFIAGCSSTQMVGTWSDPQYKGGAVKKIFFVGVAKDDLSRRLFEDEFSSRLSGMGASGVASYRYFSDAELKDNKAEVVAKMKELGCDAVLVAMAVDSRTETVVNPGRTYGTTSDYDRYRYDRYRPSNRHRSGWNDYYRSSFDITHQPATTTEFQVVTVESNLYTLDEKLIWSAQTETIVDKPVGDLIKEFVEEVSKDLGGSGII